LCFLYVLFCAAPLPGSGCARVGPGLWATALAASWHAWPAWWCGRQRLAGTLGCAAQLQLLATVVVGAVNYLLAGRRRTRWTASLTRPCWSAAFGGGMHRTPVAARRRRGQRASGHVMLAVGAASALAVTG
jgi:hypothetical protein